jgi:hypothetical protein
MLANEKTSHKNHYTKQHQPGNKPNQVRSSQLDKSASRLTE